MPPLGGLRLFLLILDDEYRSRCTVDPLLKELRHNPLFWLLALMPVALVVAKLAPNPLR